MMIIIIIIIRTLTAERVTDVFRSCAARTVVKWHWSLKPRARGVRTCSNSWECSAIILSKCAGGQCETGVFVCSMNIYGRCLMVCSDAAAIAVAGTNRLLAWWSFRGTTGTLEVTVFCLQWRANSIWACCGNCIIVVPMVIRIYSRSSCCECITMVRKLTPPTHAKYTRTHKW